MTTAGRPGSAVKQLSTMLSSAPASHRGSRTPPRGIDWGFPTPLAELRTPSSRSRIASGGLVNTMPSAPRVWVQKAQGSRTDQAWKSPYAPMPTASMLAWRLDRRRTASSGAQTTGGPSSGRRPSNMRPKASRWASKAMGSRRDRSTKARHARSCRAGSGLPVSASCRAASGSPARSGRLPGSPDGFSVASDWLPVMPDELPSSEFVLCAHIGRTQSNTIIFRHTAMGISATMPERWRRPVSGSSR